MEHKNELYGIIFKHGENDYSYWNEFSLTIEEEKMIMDILINHVTEGSSVCGTKEEISKDI